MRKALTKLVKLGITKGTPLVLVGSTAIFLKNKFKGVKDPLTLEKVAGVDGERRIVIIGGGLSGLATAYFLTNQSDKNKVTLFEKGRKCGEGSSSRNGGIFLTNDFEPWTDKSILKIIPGILSMTRP